MTRRIPPALVLAACLLTAGGEPSGPWGARPAVAQEEKQPGDEPAAADADPGDTESLESLRERLRGLEGAEAAALWDRLAERLEQESHWDAAADAWRSAHEHEPTDARLLRRGLALVAFAEEVFAAGQSGAAVKAAFEDARIALRAARTAGVDDVRVGLALARAADAVGERDRQLQELSGLVAAHPGDVRPRRALAFALLVDQQDEDAFALFSALSGASPGDQRLALGLAHVAGRLGREAEQVTACRRAVAADPAVADGWQALWRIYAPKRRFWELSTALMELAEAHPGSAVGAHFAGFACASARRFPEARGWLGRAIADDPTNVNARLELARLLRDELDERDRAVDLYAEVLTRDATNRGAAEGLHYLAVRTAGAEGHLAAIPYFRRLVELRPEEALHRADLALALRWTGQYEESEQRYLEAVERAPGDGQVRNDYGLLLLVVERRDDAADVFRAAHEVDPLHNDGLENLGFMARFDGDREGALRWFTTAWKAALRRGEDGARHRRNIDDMTWPLPPLR